MPRLIDADKIMADLNSRADYADMLIKDIKEYIAEQPTIDAVPVVRCRECRWYDTSNPCGTQMPEYYKCNLNGYYSYKENFCNAGERKADVCMDKDVLC